MAALFSHICWLPPRILALALTLVSQDLSSFNSRIFKLNHISVSSPSVSRFSTPWSKESSLFQWLTLRPPFFSALNDFNRHFDFFPPASHCCLHKLLYPIMLAHVLSRSVESTLCWLEGSRMPHKPSVHTEEILSIQLIMNRHKQPPSG